MLDKLVTPALKAFFSSLFEGINDWLEERRKLKIERRNVELEISNKTYKEAILRAREKQEREHEIRRLNNPDLTDRMRDTRRHIRESR